MEKRLTSLYMVDKVELGAIEWSPNEVLGSRRGSGLWVLVSTSSFLPSSSCLGVRLGIFLCVCVSLSFA